MNSLRNDNEDSGGGILIESTAKVEILNSTISDNSVDTSGGGLKNLDAATIFHTIFANNTPGDCSNGGAISSSFNQTGDLQNANADLLPLAHNGGPTKTHALGNASDAIDKEILLVVF